MPSSRYQRDALLSVGVRHECVGYGLRAEISQQAQDRAEVLGRRPIQPNRVASRNESNQRWI